jgi:hypothetical protein
MQPQIESNDSFPENDSFSASRGRAIIIKRDHVEHDRLQDL